MLYSTVSSMYVFRPRIKSARSPVITALATQKNKIISVPIVAPIALPARAASLPEEKLPPTAFQ